MPPIPFHSRHTGDHVDDGIDRAFAVKARMDRWYDGSVDLGNAVNSGAVVGLALDFIPTKVYLTVEMPSGGVVLTPSPIRDSLSVNGFQFKLSGLTDSIFYRLHYLLIGESSIGSGSDSGSGSESGSS